MSRLAEVKWKARDVNRTIAFTIRRRPARYLGGVLLFLAGTEASAAVAFSSPVAAWVAVACAIAAAILLSADSAQLRKRLWQRPPDEEASVTVPDGLIPLARAECPPLAPEQPGVTTEKDGMDRIDPLIAQIAQVPAEDVCGFVLVLMPKDASRPLITSTNFPDRKSVRHILSKAAREWPQ